METPHVDRMKDYEFTPIGYVDERRRRGSDPSEKGLKRSLEPATEERLTENKRLRNPSFADETFNSTRLFNDTSFDETIPEAIVQERRPNTRKTLSGDLLMKDDEASDKLTSNPLKETESSLKKLQLENYNLRIKCTSLLKFLNNISDDGKIMKNLEILDELHDLKFRHQQLTQEYRELQKKYDTLEDQNENREQQENDEELIDLKEKNKRLQEELNSSKQELEDTLETLHQSKDKIASLEEKISRLNSERSEIENQHKMKVDLLQSKINEVTTSLNLKERECDHLNEKVSTLVAQLQEFDHQSGSLLDLQSTMDSKNEAIRNLESQLQRNERQRQSLEKEVNLLQDELNSLRETQNRIIEHKDKQIKQLTESVSSNDSERLRQINELSSERDSLLEANRRLQFSENDLKESVKSLQSQLSSCQEELKNLQDKHRQEVDELLKSKAKYTSDEMESLRQELLEMRKNNELLKNENNSLSSRLDNLIRQSPSRKSVEVELLKKNNEIRALHSSIKDLEQELGNATTTISNLKDNHRREIERIRREADVATKATITGTSPVNNVTMSDHEERAKLQNKISMLQMEYESIKDTKEKELAMWKRKYETIQRTNEELLQEKEGQNRYLSGALREKDKEISELQSRYNNILAERTSMLNDLSKVKHHKEDYKTQLRKTQSRLEYITKEFVKLKETSKTAPISDESKELLNSKWFTKYQTMKGKFLDELKSLQDENLELQKTLLKQKNDSNTKASGNVGSYDNASSTGTLQDEIDYYRLKYTIAIKKQNDLRVMNEYLNKVLKASSQHVKLDILKIENEVPNYNPYADISFYNLPIPRIRKRRLRFKTVALLVLSCVRMKTAMNTVTWDKQRLEYLKRKIIMSQDRISW